MAATLDALYSSLTIHVSGAGPIRREPLECFRPVHQSYAHENDPDRSSSAITSTTNAAIPGGTLRTVHSAAMKDGVAIVYDRDIEKAFEAALGQETMLVAIEAFLDAEQGLSTNSSHPELLRRFGEYIDGLGTQPVTVTISSLVEDMMDSYASLTSGLQGFSWRQNLDFLVEEFLYTRDCWHFLPLRAPVVEATFSVQQYGVEELSIHIAFSSNAVRLGFDNLSNVVGEGERFDLKPFFPTRAHRATLPVAAEYFVGTGTDGWIQWDDAAECFLGIVPATLASHVGAERFETYTIPLELTARITKHFPADMRFERIFRCVVPLTVKRRPDRCAGDSLMADHDKENGYLRPDAVTLMEKSGSEWAHRLSSRSEDRANSSL